MEVLWMYLKTTNKHHKTLWLFHIALEQWGNIDDCFSDLIKVKTGHGLNKHGVYGCPTVELYQPFTNHRCSVMLHQNPSRHIAYEKRDTNHCPIITMCKSLL